MGHEIQKRDDYVEVRLSGEVTKFEILLIIAKLSLMDPGKHYPDLWVIGPETRLPYARFRGVSEAIGLAFVTPPKMRKTAFVVANEFQKEQCELYRLEAAALPLDIKVHLSYEDATAWIRSADNEPAT